MIVLARAAEPMVSGEAWLVMAAVVVLAAVAGAAAVPGLMAVRRGHRQRELIVAAAVLWAAATAGVALWWLDRSWTASAEAERNLMQGLVDAADPPPPPGGPWAAAGALAFAYAGLVGWSGFGPGGPPPPLHGPGAGG